MNKDFLKRHFLSSSKLPRATMRVLEVKAEIHHFAGVKRKTRWPDNWKNIILHICQSAVVPCWQSPSVPNVLQLVEFISLSLNTLPTLFDMDSSFSHWINLSLILQDLWLILLCVQNSYFFAQFNWVTEFRQQSFVQLSGIPHLLHWRCKICSQLLE